MSTSNKAIKKSSAAKTPLPTGGIVIPDKPGVGRTVKKGPAAKPIGKAPAIKPIGEAPAIKPIGKGKGPVYEVPKPVKPRTAKK